MMIDNKNALLGLGLCILILGLSLILLSSSEAQLVKGLTGLGPGPEGNAGDALYWRYVGRASTVLSLVGIGYFLKRYFDPKG